MTKKDIVQFFYRASRVHSADYARTMPSQDVRPSHAGIVSLNG